MRLECNDLLVPMHNGAVGLDWSTNDIVALFEFDDEDFRLRLLAELLTNADERVGLERARVEADCCRRDSQIRQLNRLAGSFGGQ